MIARLDASARCYLLPIGEIDLLPQLFPRVVVPQTVILEMRHDDAPSIVRNYASNLLLWISVEGAPGKISEGLESSRLAKVLQSFLLS